jgi:hypothetical protein
VKWGLAFPGMVLATLALAFTAPAKRGEAGAIIGAIRKAA